MRWTEEDLAAHRARVGIRADVSRPPFKLPNNQAGAFALGRLPTGTMNKLETAYDAHLRARTEAGEVLWHKFEGVKLRLADNTFYTPDFIVMTGDRSIEAHEIKGFMMEDANVKIKVAASIYPFAFKIVRANAKKNGGGWSIVQVGS